jgi:hypothetical protein
MTGPEYVATNDPQLLVMLQDSLRRLGELTILQRFTRSAGRRDWFIVNRAQDIDAVLARGRPRDAFSFFLRPQFAIRGQMDAGLAERIRTFLPGVPLNIDELLIAQLIPGHIQLEDVEGFSSNRQEELSQWMERHSGAEVVAGRHPPLLSKSKEEVATAIVPDQDGYVQPGVY